MKATQQSPKIDALKRYAQGDLSKGQLKTLVLSELLCSINGILYDSIDIDELLIHFNDRSELKRYTDLVKEQPHRLDIHEDKEFIELSLGYLPSPNAISLEPVEDTALLVIALDHISVQTDIAEIRRNDFTLVQQPCPIAYLGFMELGTRNQKDLKERILRHRNELHMKLNQ